MTSDVERNARDDAIVRLAQTDRRAFAPLYERYLPAVYGYCRLRLPTVELAEDVTAVVFTNVLAALPRYRFGSPGGFRAWLFTIAHHSVTDVYRERSRRPVGRLEEVDEISDQSGDPVERVLARVDADVVWSALDHLPEEQRRVVELRLAGLTDREIAVALGKSHGAVRTCQMRAVRRLRLLLQPSAGAEGGRR